MTSSRVIRPPGPVPRTSVSGTPYSAAICRATGEARTSGGAAAACGGAVGAAGDGCSTALATTPRTSPTWTTSPAWCRIFCRTPVESAVTSRFTFSVSSSTTGSPATTVSPGLLSHRPTVASTIDSPRGGTRISLSMANLKRGRLRMRRCRWLECGLDERLLFGPIEVVGTDGRAGARRAPDIRQGGARADQGAQVGLDEGPCAHIPRLFLNPDDLPERRVRGQQLGEFGGREWIELFKPHDGGLGVLCAPGTRGEINIDVSGAQDQAANPIGACSGFAVIDHRLEGAAGELGEVRGRERMAEQALWRKDHQRARLPREERGLPSEQMEVLRGGGAVRDAHVSARRELQESLDARARVLRSLTF